MRKIEETNESVTYIGESFVSNDLFEAGPTNRQELYEWFDQIKIKKSKILISGCGAMGTHYGLGIIKIGVGEIDLVDHDLVEISNLNRQLFYKSDLYKNKAKSLALRLSQYSIIGTQVRGYAMTLQEFIKNKPEAIEKYDLVAILVDNEKTRHFACEKFLNKCNVIYAGVSEDSETGYILIQKKNGKPCYKCYDRRSLSETSLPSKCEAPSISYIHQIVGGYATFVTANLLLNQSIPWNKRGLNIRYGDKLFSEIKSFCEECNQISS